ncbi:MAG: hypothetical protein GX580_00105 [Candidatus Hydrogenedens sp.]|nr:phosphodiester glycosidase family protein [Candidatus Hydrogenedentota bacterium]NLF56021.1 hypothetical protein [Candidatus Hydrogenedens sp.]
MFSRTLLMLTLLAKACVCAHSGEPGALEAPGVSFETKVFKDVPHWVVRVRLDEAPLRLHWKDEKGRPLNNFLCLRDWLGEQGKSLVFATNAGIYARDNTPLGLHVEEGVEMEPLNRKTGGGNFFLKPNGVFFVNPDGTGGVLETEEYAAKAPSPRIAVQSGPLLLRDGAIHPRFIPDSDSLYARNGVGMRSEREAVFVLTRRAVNFNDFALFFRDELGCRDALYLDGALSDMYAPALGSQSPGFAYVGMLAVAVPKAPAPAEAP